MLLMKKVDPFESGDLFRLFYSRISGREMGGKCYDENTSKAKNLLKKVDLKPKNIPRKSKDRIQKCLWIFRRDFLLAIKDKMQLNYVLDIAGT